MTRNCFTFAHSLKKKNGKEYSEGGNCRKGTGKKFFMLHTSKFLLQVNAMGLYFKKSGLMLPSANNSVENGLKHTMFFW